MQVSSVHAIASSQVAGVPITQRPNSHRSIPLHAKPSSQSAARKHSGIASGGDASGGDASGGDASGGDASGGDASGGDASGGDASGGDASGAEPSMSEASGPEPSMPEASGGDASCWSPSSSAPSMAASSAGAPSMVGIPLLSGTASTPVAQAAAKRALRAMLEVQERGGSREGYIQVRQLLIVSPTPPQVAKCPPDWTRAQRIDEHAGKFFVR